MAIRCAQNAVGSIFETGRVPSPCPGIWYWVQSRLDCTPWPSAPPFCSSLPSSWCTGQVAFESQYTYDPNGQITAINDRSPANDDRTYGYDGLNRLVSASGPWGTGSFSYDAVQQSDPEAPRLGDAVDGL